jgi:hypothetical protein
MCVKPNRHFLNPQSSIGLLPLGANSIFALSHTRLSMPSAPKKLRKQYVNSEHPVVVLRFEDGHEIVVKKGGGKTFDAYAGETIKVLAVYDKTSGERELVESRKADEFPDA